MILTSFTIQIIDTFENDRVVIEERTQQAAPQLVFNGGDDKYQSLLTSELNFNMSVPGAADGQFYHLYTGNDTRYKVVMRDQDNIVMWTGFLMPDQYSEPFQDGHLFVSMTATDGIGRLKGKFMPYEYYNGEVSVMKLIAECLKLTGLSQIINFAPAILPAANDYRWDEIVLDATQFRDEGERDVLGQLLKLPKRKSAYEILESLVKNIGCTLFTWNDEWYLIGINRKHEVNSTVLQYSTDGVLTSASVPLVRPVQPVRFVATPTVSIRSPWKKVSVTWPIDENGNLLPENAITERPDSLVSGFGLATEDPLRHWEKVGTISAGVASRDGKFLIDFGIISGGFVPVPTAVGPFNLNVGKKYATGGLGTPDYNETGETHAGTFQNFIRLKKPPYLKTSDEYIKRYITFTVNQFSKGGTNELLEAGELKNVFRCQLVVGNTSIKDNRPGGVDAPKFKYEVGFRPGGYAPGEPDSPEELLTVYTPPQTTGELDVEEISLPHNGFFNVKFFAPVSPDPNAPFFFESTFTQLKLEYTAQSEWFDELIRGIDYSTTYDLSINNGDSIQDLSKKQFRFRRYFPQPAGSDIVILNRVAVNGSPFGGLSYFLFTISYQQAQLIIANPGLLRVRYMGNDLAISQIYNSNITVQFGMTWNVTQDLSDGLWKLLFLADFTQPIFSDIDNFNIMFMSGGGVTGWVTEDNEWRESWKRFGVNENRRFGLCLGRVYHDVYPVPLVNLEGDLFGIYNPLELLQFRWRGTKIFMPLRLTLRLTEGKTSITMQETKYSNIDDYAAE